MGMFDDPAGDAAYRKKEEERLVALSIGKKWDDFRNNLAGDLLKEYWASIGSAPKPLRPEVAVENIIGLVDLLIANLKK